MSPIGFVIILVLGLLLLFAVTLLVLRQVAAGRAQAARERFPNA